MLWLRKIVFYIFCLIYLILCPLIVARLLGFVVNPKTHQLDKTGLVYVSTNPPDAAVFIDGRPAHQKTPVAIRDLAPGDHFIRIEQNGYDDWESSIPIVGKKATVLANILLIPEAWPIKRISSQPYRNIIKAADDILIATNPVLKNIGIYHTTLGTWTSLFPGNSIYASGSLVRLINEPGSPFILVEATVKDNHKFLWVNLNENPPVIEDISDLFPEIPSRIAWDNTDNKNIYAFYQTAHIDRISIKDKTVFPQEPGQMAENLKNQDAPRPQDNFLINGNNDLITREGAWIRIYPNGYFKTRQAYEIAKTIPSANIYFEEKNGQLFYLDRETGFLSAAQILPYRPILNIPIPESLMFKIPPKETGP